MAVDESTIHCAPVFLGQGYVYSIESTRKGFRSESWKKSISLLSRTTIKGECLVSDKGVKLYAKNHPMFVVR